MTDTDQLIRSIHAELEFDFVRASGPGGQNVNKLATSAQLRFDVQATSLLPQSVKARLIQLAGKRITSDGVLIIEARRFRTQERNHEDAMARLDALLRLAFRQPKRRVPTSATPASRERRLQAKKRKGEIKKVRRTRSEEF